MTDYLQADATHELFPEVAVDGDLDDGLCDTTTDLGVRQEAPTSPQHDPVTVTVAMATLLVAVAWCVFLHVGWQVAEVPASATEIPTDDVAAYVSSVASWADDEAHDLDVIDGDLSDMGFAVDMLEVNVPVAASSVRMRAAERQLDQARADRDRVHAVSAETSDVATDTADAPADDVDDANDVTPDVDVPDGMPDVASWSDDAAYRSAVLSQAAAATSDTDWLVIVDSANARLSVLADGDGSWGYVGGWDCLLGRLDTDGVSSSVGWGVDAIAEKYADAGAGSLVNPWMLSISGERGGFGIHGTWGTVAERRDAAGTPYATSGGIVVDTPVAEWLYGVLPIGTRVIVS